MKGVEFTRDMRPYGRGATILLPGDVADRLIAEGAAKPHAFPAQPYANGAIEQAAEPAVEAPRGQSYKTKKLR